MIIFICKSFGIIRFHWSQLVAVHGSGRKIKSATKKQLRNKVGQSRGVIEVKIVISRKWKALFRKV